MAACPGCGTYIVVAELENGLCRVCVTNPAASAAQGKEIELLPANVSTGTGEGFTDTVTSLSHLAQLMRVVEDRTTMLSDGLTAAGLDDTTLAQIADLIDQLEACSATAQNLHRHVKSRHASVADAVADAGGSKNVANTDWYDDH